MPAARGGGGGGSGAVRAGRAFVELFAQDNKLYRALDAASARLKQFGAMSAKIGTLRIAYSAEHNQKMINKRSVTAQECRATINTNPRTSNSAVKPRIPPK